MTDAADPLLGRQLGSYKILGILGRGGMGAVYRAEDVALARQVAIKVLPSELCKDSSERFQRFLREARSAAKLNHPNVVTIYQFGVHDGRYFIVMELVEGSTLVDILQHHGPIDARRATNIIIQAARALGAAHAQGIIHRDVKPGNIMVTRGSGMVKVADFGLAKISSMAGEITQAGDVVGTPLYMAPEQCRGEAADARSDLYSLCMTYYRLLTGVLPFEAENTHATMYKQIHEPLPDPRRFVPGIPEAVCAVLYRGMAKDPNYRHQSAAELERALLTIDYGGTTSSQAVPVQAQPVAAAYPPGSAPGYAPGYAAPGYAAPGYAAPGYAAPVAAQSPSPHATLDKIAGVVVSVKSPTTGVRFGGSNSVSPGTTALNRPGRRNPLGLALAALSVAGIAFAATWVALSSGGGDVTPPVNKPGDKTLVGPGPGPGPGTTDPPQDKEAEALEQYRSLRNRPKPTTRQGFEELIGDYEKRVVQAYPGTQAVIDAQDKIDELKKELVRHRNAYLTYQRLLKDHQRPAERLLQLQNFIRDPIHEGTEAVVEATDEIRRLQGGRVKK